MKKVATLMNIYLCLLMIKPLHLIDHKFVIKYHNLQYKVNQVQQRKYMA